MTEKNEYGYEIPEDNEENSYIDDTSDNEGKENYDDEISVYAPSEITVFWYLDGVKVGESMGVGAGNFDDPIINGTKVSVSIVGSVATSFEYDYGCVIGSVSQQIGLDSTHIYATKFKPTPKKKKFTRLYLGAVAATSGTKCFRKLQTEEYSEVTLITFTIDGTSYQAEEGMTWSEWIDSDYNTDDTWIIYTNGYIQKSDETDHTMRVASEETVASSVKSTDEIFANHSYNYSNFGAN